MKPSVSTPPSPNEVTEFSKSSCSQLICIPATQHLGSTPLQSTRSVAGCRLYSFGVPAMTLVVSCPPWQGLNHTADWAPRPPPLHTRSSPIWTSSPCKCKTATACSGSQRRDWHQFFFCVCGTALISQHWKPAHCLFFVMKVTPPLTVLSSRLSCKCCLLLPSCSVNWPDAFSNPPTSSWALGGLGPLPTWSPVLTYRQGLHRAHFVCVPCRDFFFFYISDPSLCRQMCRQMCNSHKW